MLNNRRNMKKIAALLLLMLMPRLLGAVPSRLTDGNVEFAIATVGETAVFNLEEKTRLFAKNPTAPVVDLTPKSWEVNLSTCLTPTIPNSIATAVFLVNLDIKNVNAGA